MQQLERNTSPAPSRPLIPWEIGSPVGLGCVNTQVVYCQAKPLSFDISASLSQQESLKVNSNNILSNETTTTHTLTAF